MAIRTNNSNNLFDKNNANIIINSELDMENLKWIYNSAASARVIRFKCHPNVKYSISFSNTIENTFFRIATISSNDIPNSETYYSVISVLNDTTGLKQYTFSTDSTAKHILIQVNEEETIFNNMLESLMINYGELIPYENYGSKEISKIVMQTEDGYKEGWEVRNNKKKLIWGKDYTIEGISSLSFTANDVGYLKNFVVKGNVDLDTIPSQDSPVILNGVGYAILSRLPDEYQEVEYIRSGGSTYIDIDIVPKLDDTAICKAIKDIGYSLFGSGANGYTFTGTSSGNYAYIGGSTKRSVTCNNQSIPHIWKIENRTAYCDENASSRSDQTSRPTRSLYLFARNDSGMNDSGASTIYYFKLYDQNGEIKRDLVPCYRKSDNAIGMYDLCTNRFFGKGNSNELTKGPDHDSRRTDLIILNNQESYAFDINTIYSTRSIKEIVLTGTEDWVYNGSNNHFFSLSSFENNNVVLGECLCSHFMTFNSISDENQSIGITVEQDANNDIILAIRPENYNSITLEEFKEWLAHEYANNSPVTIWYVLETPEYGVIQGQLRKVNNFVDYVNIPLDGIPLNIGENDISINSPVQPSYISITGHVKPIS